MLRSFHEGRADAETIRNAILIIGGLMAFYGLVQATKRQESFAEQVDTQIKQAETAETQLFNDRLGRGVELLAKSDKMLSKAGIRVLEDLANSVDVIEHKKIIANLLHDFIKNRAAKIYQDDKNGKMAPVPVSRGVDRSDVQLALDVYLGLMCLFDETEQRQSFTNLDLSYLNFSSFKLPDNPKDKLKKIHSINFFNSILNECNFKNLELYSCEFFGTQIERCDFTLSSCFDCEFSSKDTISFTGWEWISFERYTFIADNIKFESGAVKLTFKDCHFRSKNMIMMCYEVAFLGGGFSIFTKSERCKLNIKNTQNVDFFWTDISNVLLGSARSTSSNINALKAIYRDGRDSESFTKLAKGGVDKSKAYLKIGLRKYFIKSDAEWSEKPVAEWVAVELARMELKEHEEKSNRFGTQNIKDERERLTNKLAQRRTGFRSKRKGV
ncbi:hypothetical protein N8755_02740 [Alphaproteobacteria bacterium]|nr:hypothetical protein [Alphaproteobacteria bacterium]